MDMFSVFRSGAMALVSDDGRYRYTDVHAAYGIPKPDWDLLRSKRPWKTDERMRARSVLSEILNVSMTIAGLPSQPLPAEYVAATIACVVHPCNVFVAATRAPEAYSALDASGLMGSVEIEPVKPETMFSLVIYYLGDGRASNYSPTEDQDEAVKETTEE